MPQGFARHRNGNFTTLTALGFPVLLTLAGLTLDAAGLYVQKRRVQAITDLAALSAAGHLGSASDAAQAMLTENGLRGLVLLRDGEATDLETLRIELGRYVADPALAARARFTGLGTPTNAVKVTVNTAGQRYFLGAIAAPDRLAATAIANITPEATFTVGSRLASLNGGVANALLGSLLGTSISLSVMDYEALLDTDIALFGFADALASELHLTAGTYRDVLDASASVGTLASAAGKMPGMTASSRAALQHIVHALPANAPKIAIADLFSLGASERYAVGSSSVGFVPKVSLMELVGAAAWLANGEDQVGLTLNAGLPGVASVDVKLTIGEAAQSTPRFVTGESGAVVKTAQTRLKITAWLGQLIGTVVQLPLYVEVASAEARLASVTCDGQNPASVKVAIDATPAIAVMRVAEVPDSALPRFGIEPTYQPAKLLNATLITVTGEAQAAITNTQSTRLQFNAKDIRSGTIKSAETRNYTESLTTSLIKDLDLKVHVLGLGLGIPGNLKSSVAGVATAATPAIDTVLNSVLAVLGIKLGEADVWVGGAGCGRPALVQ